MVGIAGILSKTSMGAIGGKRQGEDPAVKSIKQQIAQTKEQMQKIKANEDMDEETKKAKIKVLQEKITELNKQMTMQQAQSQSKVEEPQTKSPMDQLQASQKKAAKNKDTVELSMPKGMGALINASSSMKQMQTMSAVQTQAKGRAAVVKSEIELDGSYGSGPTEGKVSELAELDGQISSINARMAKKSAEINNDMQKPVDKDLSANGKEQVQNKQEEEKIQKEEQEKQEVEKQEEE